MSHHYSNKKTTEQSSTVFCVKNAAVLMNYIVLALTYFPLKRVSSALGYLTAVFGMETGVTTPPEAPGP